MNKPTGTVFDDPEELNRYVKETTEKAVQESLEQIQRDQDNARNKTQKDDD